MKTKRFVSTLLALLLVCSLPVSAFADTWYLENGDITVNATESGQTVTQGAQVDVPDSAPVITQSNSEMPTTNTVTINADAGATANVTLSGVNIDVSGTGDVMAMQAGKAAVEITGNGDVTIELDEPIPSKAVSGVPVWRRIPLKLRKQNLPAARAISPLPTKTELPAA